MKNHLFQFHIEGNNKVSITKRITRANGTPPKKYQYDSLDCDKHGYGLTINLLH